MAKPRSRSRQYNRDNNLVDFEQARKRRANRRREEAQKKQKEVREEITPRQKKKRNRKWMIIAGAVLLLVIILGVASINVFKLEKEKMDLEKRNAQLQKQLEQKESELANSDDPEYIEKLVREKLHMVYPGEILYLKKDEEDDKDQ